MNRAANLSINDIKNIISSDEIKIISFDIFDTLLVRPSVKPKDIFYLLNGVQIGGQNINFAKLRMNAEEALNDSYATIEQIWDSIGENNKVFSNEDIKLLMCKELELEKQMLTVRNDVYEVYKYAVSLGKRIIATSDMYIPSNILKDILTSKGYNNIKEVYVSCEAKKRKDEGKLFEYVIEKEKIVDPSSMVHIGDNFYSDYKIPIEKGITALYYPSIWTKVLGKASWWRKAFPYDNFSEDPYIRLLYSFTFLRAYNHGYVLQEDRCFKNIKDFTQMFLAPLVTSVVLDIINDKNIQNEYKQILFSARDGYLPLQVYNIFAKNINTLPASYLYLSRRALSYIRYKDFFEYFDKISPLGTYTVEEFVRANILNQNVQKNILETLDVEDKSIDLLSNQQDAKKALKKCEDILNTYFISQKELALKYYYNAVNSLDGERQIVFDCGYSGSVSSGLMPVCKNKVIDKYYLWQTQDNRIADKKNGTKTFCKFDTEVPVGVNIIIEECLSPAEGSHVGFVQKDIVRPILERLDLSETFKNDLDIIYSTVCEYSEEFITTFKQYLDKFNFSQQDIFSSIARYAFLKSPTGELRLFNDFCFPDSYTRGNAASLSYKVEKTFELLRFYTSPFSGTGFLIKDNYLKSKEEKCYEGYKIGIHYHLFNRYLLQEFYGYIKELPVKFDLIITVTEETMPPVVKKTINKKTVKNLNEITVIVVENRGRDVAPWVVNTANCQEKYDLFCHVHAKVSKQYYADDGERWRKYLFDNLLDKRAFTNIIELFRKDEKLGLVFPECFNAISDIFNSGKDLTLLGCHGEEKMMEELFDKMGLQNQIVRFNLAFSMGTMMWYRPKALKPLFDIELKSEDFPEEPIGIDGTIAHAIERMPGLVAKSQGYELGFYTEYPQDAYGWRQNELSDRNINNSKNDRRDEIGVSGAFKVFVNKHFPFLFKEVVGRYEGQMGLKKAIIEYLAKGVKGLFNV